MFSHFAMGFQAALLAVILASTGLNAASDPTAKSWPRSRLHLTQFLGRVSHSDLQCRDVNAVREDFFRYVSRMSSVTRR